jgi:hypothetical protein
MTGPITDHLIKAQQLTMRLDPENQHTKMVRLHLDAAMLYLRKIHHGRL